MKSFSSTLIGALNKSVWVAADPKMFKKVNELAIKAGYLVHPNACSDSVIKFLKEQVYNPNATFFKSWSDIAKRSETELCLAQALHYMSTYGVSLLFGEDVVEGNGFVPNKDPAIMAFGDLKLINAAQPKEIFADLYGMLKSGIAMSNAMVKDTVEFIKDYNFEASVKLDEVANREAQALLSVALGKLPTDEFAMLRIIAYYITGSTLLIKNEKTIQALKYGSTIPEVQTLLNNLTEEQMKNLSKIFLRYKPLFLAMKSGAPATINRIRRLAVKNHKPLKIGLWERILVEQNEDDLSEAFEKVEELNNYRKIQLMEAILYRKQHPENQFYHIRNGKTFIRADYQPAYNADYFDRLYCILMDSLVKGLHKKYTKEDGTQMTVKLPKGLMLVCPTSEKNFVGNIPAGSYVKFAENGGTPADIIFGIYWRGEWGTQDFDLHYQSFDGRSFGWNACHKVGTDLMFSGDMTRANPEASECFFLSGDAPEGTLSCYRYWGDKPTSKFKVWVAKEQPVSGRHVSCKDYEGDYGFDRRANYGYMADPANIVFDSIIDCEDNGEHQIGCVIDNKLYFTNESLNGGRVPNKNTNDLYKEAVPKKLNSHIVLKDLLTVAGIPVVEGDTEADIDLSVPNKADLINFFSTAE